MLTSRLGIALCTLGIVGAVLGLCNPTWAKSAPVLYGCFNAIGVGLMYIINRPAWTGKTPDGRLPWWSIVLWAPYFVAMALAWRVRRSLTDERAYDRVSSEQRAPLYVGRRLLNSDTPPEGLAFVVDLTCEFWERDVLRTVEGYRTLPTLDGKYPSDEVAFRRTVNEVAGVTGGVYVHCAYGHGRAALTGAAVLLARGEATDVDDALDQLRRARPGTRLSRGQRQWLDRYVAAGDATGGGDDADAG